jgi:hypothetical protein
MKNDNMRYALQEVILEGERNRREMENKRLVPRHTRVRTWGRRSHCSASTVRALHRRGLLDTPRDGASLTADGIKVAREVIRLQEPLGEDERASVDARIAHEKAHEESHRGKMMKAKTLWTGISFAPYEGARKRAVSTLIEETFASGNFRSRITLDLDDMIALGEAIEEKFNGDA